VLLNWIGGLEIMIAIQVRQAGAPQIRYIYIFKECTGDTFRHSLEAKKGAKKAYRGQTVLGLDSVAK
jgi:hypothetical protein